MRIYFDSSERRAAELAETVALGMGSAVVMTEEEAPKAPEPKPLVIKEPAFMEGDPRAPGTITIKAEGVSHDACVAAVCANSPVPIRFEFAGCTYSFTGRLLSASYSSQSGFHRLRIGEMGDVTFTGPIKWE